MGHKQQGLYRIHLDFADEEMRVKAREHLLQAEMFKKLVITEYISSQQDLPSTNYNLIIFDDKYKSEQQVMRYCVDSLVHSPCAIFMHISDNTYKNEYLHLLSISRNFFFKYFKQLIGFCYLNHLVRDYLIAGRTIHKKP